MLLFTAVLNATTPTQENVTELYVAMFDRAPDSKGLDYWVKESGLDLEGIAESFFGQEETQIKYPPSTTEEEFIRAVYENLFNRPIDAAGMVYWKKELESGNIPRSLFVLAVINGALGDDAKILDNKTIVGLAFAKAGLDDPEDAKCVLKCVTADDDTVEEGLEKVEGVLDSGMCNPTCRKDPIPTPPTPPTPEPKSTLKKTGQTISYDENGQEVTDGSLKDDGYYQSGVDPDYERNSDDTVTDHITGLMWADDANVASVTKPWLTTANYNDCRDNGNNCENTAGDTAATYCAGLSLGGYSDWRLPTSVELEGIVDYGRVSSSIDPTYFQNTSSYDYWSSTTYEGGKRVAWYVYFYSGHVSNYGKDGDVYVRCVRAGQ